ncbi:MAG: restriction endonuclease [Elusimicrobiota bacterium]|nr:restriction endonuclease [Elusimicrobiota bacterium]
MDYRMFENILNEHIFERSKSDLLRKIANEPHRYIGLFRPSKPKAKVLQNLLQSQEIRFGDALEIIFRHYFELLGYENLENKMTDLTDELDLDQLFKDKDFVYFAEQKVRDDHDSTKKRGQIDNFEKKISALIDIYGEKKLKCFMYFVDPTLIKNKSFYEEKIESIKRDYAVFCKLCYGSEFWETLGHIDVWNELLNFLKKWRDGIPDIPSINFDIDAESAFSEIKTLPPIIYRKIFGNEDICRDIIPAIFPQKKTLKLLSAHFDELAQSKAIYQTLSEKLKERLK